MNVSHDRLASFMVERSWSPLASHQPLRPLQSQSRDSGVLGERGDRSSPCSPWRKLQLALQLAGVVELFGLEQSGPKPDLASGTLSMANGPALCSPLKGRWLGRVEVTGGQSRRFPGIVKPETQMKRIRRNQTHVGIKTEDIVQKNRFDLDVAVIGLPANLDIGLIPGQAEAARETRVLGAIGLEEAVLDSEQVKVARPGLIPSRSRIRVSFCLPRMTVARARGSS